MKDGFIKVAAVTPELKVADVAFNTGKICEYICEAAWKQAKIVAFPELCVTGYTCGDLFTQDTLIHSAEEALKTIAAATADKDMLVFVGVPVSNHGKLYNTAAAISRGRILAFVTKTFLPNYGEFYEMRQFTAGPEYAGTIYFDGEEIPFGPQILFECSSVRNLVVSAEICEDVWSPVPPSIYAAREGATVIVNCSASDETVGKARYRRALIAGQSARLISGYIYANAGEGESTTDLVFGGRNMIAENGAVLAEAACFENGIIYSEIDVDRIQAERRKNTTFAVSDRKMLVRVPFDLQMGETELTRRVSARPFIPQDASERSHVCEEILNIQATGLKKRVSHAHAKTAVLGISGGLDSTLALLVTARSFDMLGMDRSNVVAVTMPCFGTTDRTYENACALARCLGATLREIPIAESVTLHFRDIGHDINDHSITFENAQARERTQVIMDIANQTDGLVVGTGDLSELALGWATYNGDHMSMYGVNGSVPKTLIRFIVDHCAETTDNPQLKKVLKDVLETPVSPELLPLEDGRISQKTEDIVGPYDLHDFFLYYLVRFGFTPSKILRLAKYAFNGEFDDTTIERWLRVFLRRFFTQQFKRSCLPDGPKVGTVALSPRGDWRMPSDACPESWLADL